MRPPTTINSLIARTAIKPSDTATRVKAKPLGNMLTDNEIKRVRLIKIDAEGHEYEVLKGIYPLLDQLPDNVEFIIEIDPSKIEEKELLEIFDKFKSHGFERYEFDNNYDPRFYIDFVKGVKPNPTTKIPNKTVDNLFTKRSL